MHRSTCRWPLSLPLLAVYLWSHCLTLGIMRGLSQTSSWSGPSEELSRNWGAICISTSHSHFIDTRLIIKIVPCLISQTILGTILRQHSICSLLMLLLLLNTILLRIVLSLLMHLESFFASTAYQLCSLMVYLHLYSSCTSLRNWWLKCLMRLYCTRFGSLLFCFARQSCWGLVL